MLTWLWRLTGGRPMKHEGTAFFDRIGQRNVHFFIDKFGRRWLAEHRWAQFRVRKYGLGPEQE